MTCLFLVSIFVHCFGCSLPQDAIYTHKPNLPDPPAQIASFEREKTSRTTKPSPFYPGSFSFSKLADSNRSLFAPREERGGPHPSFEEVPSQTTTMDGS